MRGILWMLATMLCFITLDAIMKHLLESYSLVQVTWARFFFATIIAALVCGRNLGRLARTISPGKQAIRSLLLMSTTAVFNAGIRTTPLATATTIMFLSPLLVTLLSIPLLGEKVGLRRWMAVLVGFVGVMVIMRPGSMDFHWAMMISLMSALFGALYNIATRKVGGSDGTQTSLFYVGLVGSLGAPGMGPTVKGERTPAGV